MHASVAETWSVADLDALQAPVLLRRSFCSVNGSWKHLLDGLDSIVESIKTGCLYLDSLLCDRQSVCLMWHIGVEDESDSITVSAFAYLIIRTGRYGKLSCKSLEQFL